MKKLERSALVLIILYIIATLLDRVGRVIMTTSYGTEWSGTKTALLTLPAFLIALSVNIIIAIWIYRMSKKEGVPTPWVWALFGFLFSAPGAILFYVVRIYEILKTNRSEPVN